MIHLKPSLDKRRQRNDGTYPVVLRLTYKGKSRSISTGIYVDSKNWDNQNSFLITNSKSLTVMGERLQEELYSLQQKILEYQRYKLSASSDVQSIKEYITGNLNRSTTVLEFWDQEIARLKSISNYGNARNYRSAKLGFQKVQNLNIPFSKVDYTWLIQSETKMKSNGVQINGIAVYMRTIRALYNKAINYGLVGSNEYPFRSYKIKSTKTTPKVLSIEELRAFFNTTLEEDSFFYNSWNFGRLIFMLRGINFADLALLTDENIKYNRIVYRRRKTHKIYSIEILPEVLELINLYKTKERNTLFPILSNEEYMNKANLPIVIEQKRKTCNKWLKKLGEELKLSEKLSTYVFRYSWANAAKSLGYSKDLIAESLGHEYGNSVTGIYLNDFDEETIDEMNLIVCNHLTK